VNTYGRKIESPLTIAIRGKRYEVVDMLLRHGANPNILENDGETALFKAIHGGNIKTAQLLVEKYGADPNNITSNGMTTLHAAALSGSTEIISLLI
ncbi:ankyrin, partial [Stipitochalara longipes BDJ]